MQRQWAEPTGQSGRIKKKTGLQISPWDVFRNRVLLISKVYSLGFPVYFPHLENTRQTPTLKIHINLTPETNATGKIKRCLYFTVHLKVMQIKNIGPWQALSLCKLSYICTVNIHAYTHSLQASSRSHVLLVLLGWMAGWLQAPELLRHPVPLLVVVINTFWWQRN